MSGWRPGAKAVAITKRMGIVVLILEGVNRKKVGTVPSLTVPTQSRGARQRYVT